MHISFSVCQSGKGAVHLGCESPQENGLGLQNAVISALEQNAILLEILWHAKKKLFSQVCFSDENSSFGETSLCGCGGRGASVWTPTANYGLTGDNEERVVHAVASPRNIG